MKKKLICCGLMLCILTGLLAFPSVAAEKVLIRMDSTTQKSYEIIEKDGSATMTDEGLMCNSSTNVAVYYRPAEPVKISRMDTLIRYRFKVDMEEPVDYIAVRLYDASGDAATAQTAVSKPASGEWYEGSFPLHKAKVSTGKRQFKAGDELKQIQLNVKNTAGIEVNLTCDYLEIVEPDGPDSSPAIFESEDIGIDYIQKLNSKIASAKAGDVIEIDDGIYSNCTLEINAYGSKDKPVTIKAKNPGKAIFTGTSSAVINGSYITVDGLYFKDGMHSNVIQFAAGSDHCRLTNTAVVNYNAPDIEFQSKWVFIQGTYHTVDHCYFRNKNTMGQMLEVIRKSDEPDYHVIENNYFGYFEPGPGNGYETVRVGTSTYSLSASNTLFKGNFFERCDGEAEIISNKSCGNTFTNNTFYDSKGALTLRHGNDSVVNGNLFIGGAPTVRTTGVRVIGERNKVYDNYFFNMSSGSNSVTIENGVPNAELASYAPVTDLDFHNNTFIGGDRELWVGAYNSPSATPNVNRIIPPQGKIYDNAFLTFKGKQPIIENGDVTNKVVFENNSVYGKELGYEGGVPSGISLKDPNFEKTDSGFYKPSDGIGADIENLKAAPKNPFDVICGWVKKDLYDSGLYTFQKAEIDPINDAAADVSKLFPSNDKINIRINDYFISFDVAPQLINDRTMVPMRAIFENLNARVDWDEATASATAIRTGTTIKITENSSTASVNGKEVILDSPAVIIDDRFLVPIRFISESFGAEVKWDDISQTVFIYMDEEKKKEIKADTFLPQIDIPNALTVHGILQSGDDGDGNSIQNTLDGKMGTRWAVQETEGVVPYGIFDLGETHKLDKIALAFYKGDSRTYYFSVEVSEDGQNYTRVLDNVKSSGSSNELEYFNLKGVSARYVKYVGGGNDSNKWNNITEIVFVEMKESLSA